MDNPLISVIVPVYQVENYLEQCLDSILAQTWKNLEILLIDDASPDQSGAICDRYAEKDFRITVFHLSHRGVSAARNYAIDVAHGDWICFVDSDDWLEPNMYEIMVKNGLRYNASVSVCGRYREYLDGHNETIVDEGTRLFCGTDEILDAFYKRRLFSNSVSTKLYRREFFDQGLRFPEGRKCEEVFLFTRVLFLTEKLVFTGLRLYHYRMRRGSTVNQAAIDSTVDLWRAWIERHNEVLRYTDAYKKNTMNDCFYSIQLNWRTLCSATAEERRKFSGDTSKMSLFSRSNLREVLTERYPLKTRIVAVMTQHDNLFSYWLVYCFYRVYSVKKNLKKRKHMLYP